MREKIIDLLYAENVRSDCGIERLADEICAIDAVEVMRCKDCRHWHDDGYCNKWDNGPGHPEVWENDFCSFGERREE